MNVEKGTFQAIKPPNIYGNNRYLAKDTNYIISYDANIGKNKTIPLPEVTNLRKKFVGGELPEVPADINYRLIENTLGLQFYKLTKESNDSYFGFGGGVQNFPYGFLTFGHNGKFVEVGGAAYWGLTIDNASYEGEYTHFVSHKSSSESEYIKLKNADILHSYGGFTAYTSLFWEKFALNYAASIANPWLVVNLPVSQEDKAEVSFWFPVLLMQDIGISYAPGKMKYRLGVNQITGVKFPGQYWGLSAQIAHGW